jgi:hypothetical protein
MVGGTIFHRRVIQREISRVLVLNPLWQKSGGQNTDRISLSLTPPSLLSRATHDFAPTCGNRRLSSCKHLGRAHSAKSLRYRHSSNPTLRKARRVGHTPGFRSVEKLVVGQFEETDPLPKNYGAGFTSGLPVGLGTSKPESTLTLRAKAMISPSLFTPRFFLISSFRFTVISGKSVQVPSGN